MAATTEDYAAQGGIRQERLKRWVWIYSNDVLHRDGGLPAVISDDGSKHWYFYGTRHREDGPALEAPDFCEWWFHGKLHRIDGPATEMGPVPVLWCVDGKKFPNGDDDEYKQACLEYLNAHKNKGKLTKRATGT